MKIFTKCRMFFITLLLSPIFISSQSETIFNEIRLENNVTDVHSKLKTISEKTILIKVDSLRLPLAKAKETHLFCENIKTKHGTIEKAVFTFADNKLCYIEAKGNAIETLKKNRKDTAITYLDYSVFVNDKLFFNKKKDKIWILNQEGMHLNLFTWENPYLNLTNQGVSKLSGKIPSFLKMGANFDSLLPILEENSSFTNIQKLNNSDPNAQIQVNCFGVEYFGFPRKIEARFGDNRLNSVWILTSKGEENRIRKELTKHYGKPIFTNEIWEVFDNWKIGLRKDKPEILLLTQKLGLLYKEEYFKL